MRALMLLMSLTVLLRGRRARAPRDAAHAIPVAPRDDAASAQAQLERVAACWATRHGAMATPENSASALS